MTLAEYRQLFDLDEQRAPPKRSPAKAVASIDDVFIPISFPGLKLHPEEALSVQLYRALVVEHRAGRLKAVCTCIPNELPRPSKGGRGIQGFAISVQNKRRAMGRIPGAHDWVFTWATGNLWAELKRPGGEMVMRQVQRAKGPALRMVKSAPGTLSPEQVAFQGWCDRLGVPKTTWFSVEQALDELRERGAIAHSVSTAI